MSPRLPSSVVWPEPVATTAVSATGLALLSTLSAPLGAAVLALGSLGLVAGLITRTPRGRVPDPSWGVMAALLAYFLAPTLPVWFRSLAIAITLVGLARSRARTRPR